MENETPKQEETKALNKAFVSRIFLIITYLIYIIFWESLCLCGGAYMVIHFDRSGWWMLLAVVCGGACFKPHTWYGLWDGIEYKTKDEDD